ncbi:MAG: lipocalin family protein [Bacteroidia bacterium]|nr:lipocalin family protein [Bacteroidia bacterium]
MTKYFFTFFAFCYITHAFSQPSIAIQGKWKLTKHTITKKGKTLAHSDSSRVTTFDFLSNGNYSQTDSYTNPISTYVTKGKWKINEKHNKVHLYENTDSPDDPQIIIGDFDLKIIKLNGEYFLTYSYLDTEFPPDTDYYKKIK